MFSILIFNQEMVSGRAYSLWHKVLPGPEALPLPNGPHFGFIAFHESHIDDLSPPDIFLHTEHILSKIWLLIRRRPLSFELLAACYNNQRIDS